MSGIRIDSVSKVFGGGVRAVDDVSLEIADGEFVVLVGPSGSGKSTLLRMIAGLEEVSTGTIFIGDRDVTFEEPRTRDIAMVFQNYALYPNMNVRDNLRFPLKMAKVRRAEQDSRVAEVAKTLGLEDLLDRKPRQLSGGQQQRVAMGRAMVREPQAYLMDEPLSNLDAKLRVTVRAELARLHHDLQVTTVYVTHDQIEAMTLGQRVAVLRDGQLQQFDTPVDLYRRPCNLFVAAFMGSPSMNLVEAQVADGVVRFGKHAIDAPQVTRGIAGPVVLGIRPTDLEPVATADPAFPRLTVTPDLVENLGSQINAVFPIGARRVTAEQQLGGDSNEGQLLASDEARFLVEVSSRVPIEPNREITFAIDPEHLYLFSIQTGANLRLT